MNLDFKIYTNALKAYENDMGEKFVAGTTSSSIRDLHGDEMSLNALKSMADTARQNMTVFLNHNYNVPEDLFGSATDAEIIKRWDSETNQEVYDLDVNIRVVNEDENPEALRAYRAIKRGVKLGLSIGARVEKASRKAADGDQPESIVIEKVRLLEASVVGIPANQRSYLHSAIKSIKSAGVDLDLLDEDDFETKASKYAVGDMVRWGSSGGDATGKITKIVREGRLSVPGSSFVLNATPEDPAVLIRLYREGKPTETLVGHKMSTLRSAKEAVDVIDSVKEFEAEGEDGSIEKEKPEMPGDAPESAESSVENSMDSELEKKTRVTVTVSTDNEDKQPVAAPAVSEDETNPVEKEEVKASASPDGEEDAPVEEPEEAEEPAKDPSVAALEALGAKLVEEEKSLDGDESSVQPEAAEAEVVVEAPVEEAPAAEVVEADVTPLEEVKSIAKSALDAANAAHEEVAALKAQVTELAEAKAKVEEDMSKALDLIERISALGVGRKSIDVPQGIQVKAAENAPWLSPYVQRVLEAQKD
jgi:HK97 family phage prohead protease